MAKKKNLKVGQSVGRSDAVIGQELGIINVMPGTSWSIWNGGPLPKDTNAINRDPLAPDVDELVFMLRRDGQASAMLKLLTLPIRQAFAKSKWTAPDGSTGGTEVEFANNMWNLPESGGGMAVSKSLFLNQTLLALAHGFSAFEVVRKIPEDGLLKGKITIDKMGYRDPRTVTFLTDANGNYKGFRQITNFAGRRIDAVIDADNAWYYAAQEEQNPMYGVSYFEAAFQHYQMKRKLYYIAHLAAQLGAVPGRVGEIPLGASPKDIIEFKNALSNFAFNSSMVMKTGFKVEDFNSNNNALAGIQSMVDHHNTMMCGSIIAKFLQQEDRQVLIDNGKADASADMFVQMLEAITVELSESWTNKLMPQFMDYNFGTSIYPVHHFEPLTDENKQAIYDLFGVMVGLSNINATPEFVRMTEMELSQRFGFEIDYQKVSEEEQKAAEDAKAAQEAQFAQQSGQQEQKGQDNNSKLPGVPANPAKGQKIAGVKPGGNAGPASPAASTRLPTAIPSNVVKASAPLLNAINTLGGVPDDFIYEPETQPETQED